MILTGAYSLVILLDWKYENEVGVQELVIIASTLWLITCLFGRGEVDEKAAHAALC
jgi:hypothetical protein